MNEIYRSYIKRFLDFIISAFLLIILSPVYCLVSIIVSIKLGNPILFKQERPGLNGKVFTMLKFRSMTDGKDVEGNLLPDDIRLTKFGKVFRSTSLDELPELFNILKGEMSFVGPRPLLPKYMNLYTDEQMTRHEVRPGLTGLAQVNGRNAITWEQKFDFDVEYVKKCSFILDVKIILKTIKVVFFREDINSSHSDTSEEFMGTK